MISALETAITNRLLSWAGLADFQVEPWPEKPENYSLDSPNGALLIAYKGSNYGGPIPSDVVAQNRAMEFEIRILVRSLRDHSGGYSVIEEVRKAITGWVPEGATRSAYPTKDGFLSEENGIWTFVVDIAVPTLSVQMEPPTDTDEIYLMETLGGGQIQGAIESLGGNLSTFEISEPEITI